MCELVIAPKTLFLRRVERPSAFGTWSYEVIDTKLARETKGNTVLQISLYSDLLAELNTVANGAKLGRSLEYARG
jgi:predicted RecB family nuclease